MALRPWVKRLINEVTEIEIFDVDNGRRSYAPPPTYRRSLQDMIPELENVWRDCQAVQQWWDEKLEEIFDLPISDEEKLNMGIQALYMGYAATLASWGVSDIPSFDGFQDMIRAKFATKGIAM